MIYICKVCTKEIKDRPSHKRKFCSPKCKNLFQRERYMGLNNPNWQGGIHETRSYIYIRQPSHPFANSIGYVLEHRLVMERKLGRYLKPTEIVHHINHIRNDNRIENLELFKNNSEHFTKSRHGGENWKGKFGKDSHCWKGGLPNCLDCNKQLGRRESKRCQKHSAIARWNQI